MDVTPGPVENSNVPADDGSMAVLYTVLRREIVERELRPGSVRCESEHIAAQRICRTTVHNTLAQSEHDGLLDRAGRGNADPWPLPYLGDGAETGSGRHESIALRAIAVVHLTALARGE